MLEKEIELNETIESAIHELASTIGIHRARVLIGQLTQAALNASFQVIETKKMEVMKNGQQMGLSEARGAFVALNQVGTDIAQIHNRIINVAAQANANIRILPNAIDFGIHALDSREGSITCHVKSDVKGFCPDVRFDFSGSNIDVDGIVLADDYIFIVSVNQLFSSLGYQGPAVGRAEIGMQGERVVTIEGGKEFSAWMESKGWIDLDKGVVEVPEDEAPKPKFK